MRCLVAGFILCLFFYSIKNNLLDAIHFGTKLHKEKEVLGQHQVFILYT